jgi:hypothetical protein
MICSRSGKVRNLRTKTRKLISRKIRTCDGIVGHVGLGLGLVQLSEAGVAHPDRLG